MAGPAARGCDAALDSVVVALATWTVVYHVCFVAGIGSTAALGAEVVLLGLASVVWLRGRRASAPSGRPPEDAALDGDESWPAGRLTWAVAGLALVAGAGMALRFPWAVVCAAWLLAAAGGTVLAWRGLSGAEGVRQRATTLPVREAATWALLLTVAAAVFSLVTIRPNPDDLFYVNLSQWVAAHGSFPHRDTIFSEGVYPIANWPPLASYDAGAGALAHVLGVRAGTVVYVVVSPLMSALSVLALWRLLRAWRVRAIGVALTAATVFLLFDGTSSYGSPGNLWVTRLWQGKVILLCIVVPVLLVLALRYVDRPGRRGLAWLFVVGTAAVGCSTTAIFLVPVVAVAAMAPLALRSPRRAALGWVATSAYPLASGVVTLVVGGRSADDFGTRRQYRFDPSWFGHEVFLDGVVGLVGVVAVLLAWRVLPHPAARVTSAVAALLVGVTFVPGVTRLTYDLVGLGPTLWRLTWALAVAASVGAVASWAHGLVRTRARAWGAGALAAVVVAALGHPVWAAETSTSFAAPFHWQRGEGSRAVTSWALDRTPPGERFLGPDELSITLAVTSTDVQSVAPRDYYMDYLRDVAGFRYADRLALVRFANHEDGWSAAQVGSALRTLEVGTACVYRTDAQAQQLLDAQGFRLVRTTEVYACFVAGAPFA